MKRKMVAYLQLIFVAAMFTIYGLLLSIQTDVRNRNPSKTGSVRLHQKQTKRAAVNNDDHSIEGNIAPVHPDALIEPITADVITTFEDHTNYTNMTTTSPRSTMSFAPSTTVPTNSAKISSSGNYRPVTMTLKGGATTNYTMPTSLETATVTTSQQSIVIASTDVTQPVNDDEGETSTSPGTSYELRSQTSINKVSTSNVNQSTSGRDINTSTRAALTTSPNRSSDMKEYVTFIFFGSACMISLLSVIVIYLCVRNCQKDRKLRSLEGTNDNTEEDPWITETTERNMDLPAPVLEKKNEVLPFHKSLPTLITTSQDELRYTIAGLKKPTPLRTFTPGPETFRRQIPQSGMKKFIKTNERDHLGNRTVANDIKLKKIVPTAESEGWADNVAYEAFKTANKKVISDLETSCMDDHYYEVVEM
ncbi:uncharacterized protein [Apostichopus japonicus]|uniref:uncharacterized protein isoform X2 n=1 Tax=Stichopus japonicus TaxID=307972 RepID=UPI003AB76951